MEMEFRFVGSVPPSKTALGKGTIECMEKLSSLEVGDIIHLPISEIEETELRTVTSRKYLSALGSARSRIKDKKFKMMKRGWDIYVERKK